MPDFGEYQTRARMEKKLAAVPLPDLNGKHVLDIGCDHGYWCQLAKDKGATRVIGLDRGREVKGKGFVDIVSRNREAISSCEFYEQEIGRQYMSYGRFDVVLVLNMYHHAYNVSGDHETLWFWLRQQTEDSGTLMWESPVDTSDGVALKDIRPELHAGYNETAIRAAAERYFDIEDVGAGWLASRRVWRCTPRTACTEFSATVKDGAGGASKAFLYNNTARINELEEILGIRIFPGSLNLQADEAFDWSRGYYRAQIGDVVDRKKGLDSAWAPRWCRLYPVSLHDHRAYAMRFEGERYKDTLVELIAPHHIRSNLFLDTGEKLCLRRL